MATDQKPTKSRRAGGLTVVQCEAAPVGYTADARAPGLYLRTQVGKRRVRRTWVFRHGRSQHVLGTFPDVSPDDARRLAAIDLAKVAKRRDPMRELRSASVSDVIDDFKRTHVTRKQGRQPTDDPDVKRRLERIVDALGKRPIADVRRLELAEFLEPYRDRPTEYRNTRALLRQLWKHAVRSELAPSGMAIVPGMVTPPREPPRQKVQANAHALMRVIEVAQKYALRNPDAGLCVQAITLLGCRPGEAMGLRWDDVDLNGGTVLWRERKEGDSMRLPLPGALLLVLREIRDARPDDVFVFRGRRGGHITELRRAWAWIRKSAKLPAGMRLYDVRGSVASLIANASGVTAAAAVLGHASSQTTLSHYTQATDDARRQAVDMLGAAISAEIQRAAPPDEGARAWLRELAAAGDVHAAAVLRSLGESVD